MHKSLYRRKTIPHVKRGFSQIEHDRIVLYAKINELFGNFVVSLGADRYRTWFRGYRRYA